MKIRVKIRVKTRPFQGGRAEGAYTSGLVQGGRAEGAYTSGLVQGCRSEGADTSRLVQGGPIRGVDASRLVQGRPIRGADASRLVRIGLNRVATEPTGPSRVDLSRAEIAEFTKKQMCARWAEPSGSGGGNAPSRVSRSKMDRAMLTEPCRPRGADRKGPIRGGRSEVAERKRPIRGGRSEGANPRWPIRGEPGGNSGPIRVSRSKVTQSCGLRLVPSGSNRVGQLK